MVTLSYYSSDTLPNGVITEEFSSCHEVARYYGLSEVDRLVLPVVFDGHKVQTFDKDFVNKYYEKE